MTTAEMRKKNHKPGYCWRNIAPLGEKPDWVEAIQPPDVDVNDRRLFGYEESEFLAKQYK